MRSFRPRPVSRFIGLFIGMAVLALHADDSWSMMGGLMDDGRGKMYTGRSRVPGVPINSSMIGNNVMAARPKSTDCDVRLREVIALEQQRFTGSLGKCIGETVAEI